MNIDPFQMLANNPKTKELAEQIKQGKDPKQLFYDECAKRHIDPNMIINLMRGYR